ncbi:atherin-like, partial [Pogonomyrmex barbatus]|uniref:Atherin-like n=1 Tax=Pogonomyrmex barbatus TaxID=144034 RepID=A0A6I9VTE8_9HYME
SRQTIRRNNVAGCASHARLRLAASVARGCAARDCASRACATSSGHRSLRWRQSWRLKTHAHAATTAAAAAAAAAAGRCLHASTSPPPPPPSPPPPPILVGDRFERSTGALQHGGVAGLRAASHAASAAAILAPARSQTALRQLSTLGAVRVCAPQQVSQGRDWERHGAGERRPTQHRLALEHVEHVLAHIPCRALAGVRWYLFPVRRPPRPPPPPRPARKLAGHKVRPVPRAARLPAPAVPVPCRIVVPPPTRKTATPTPRLGPKTRSDPLRRRDDRTDWGLCSGADAARRRSVWGWGCRRARPTGSLCPRDSLPRPPAALYSTKVSAARDVISHSK